MCSVQAFIGDLEDKSLIRVDHTSFGQRNAEMSVVKAICVTQKAPICNAGVLLLGETVNINHS